LLIGDSGESLVNDLQERQRSALVKSGETFC